MLNTAFVYGLIVVGFIIIYLLIIIFAPGFHVPKQPLVKSKKGESTAEKKRTLKYRKV